MNFQAIQSYSDIVLSRQLPSYKRFLFEKISIKNKLTGVVGPKGTGKTIILLQVAISLGMKTDEILYVSCDMPNMANVSLYELANKFQAEGGKLLIIDEIHFAKDFCMELKQINESFTELAIFYSGSSAIRINGCKTADLSRRAVEFVMPPMSFREYLELEKNVKLPKYTIDDIIKNKRTIINTLLKANIKPLRDLKRYMICGGFPFYRDRNNESDFLLSLGKSVSYIIEQEIARGTELSSIEKMKQIISDLCTNSQLLYSPSEIAKTYWKDEKNRNTARIILSKLAISGLISVIKKHKGNTLGKGDIFKMSHPNFSYSLCKLATELHRYDLFFVSQLTIDNTLFYDKNGYIVNDKDSFSFNKENGYYKMVAKERGEEEDEIPIWLFGFLY